MFRHALAVGAITLGLFAQVQAATLRVANQGDA